MTVKVTEFCSSILHWSPKSSSIFMISMAVVAASPRAKANAAVRRRSAPPQAWVAEPAEAGTFPPAEPNTASMDSPPPGSRRRHPALQCHEAGGLLGITVIRVR